MKELKKVRKENVDSVENLKGNCVCRAYQCSIGCDSDDNVYSGQQDAYNFSKRVSYRGLEPWSLG